MTWNHRICRKSYTSPAGYSEICYSIREAYYNPDKVSLWAVTEDPVGLITCDEDLNDEEAIVRLRQQLQWMLKALDAPVVDLDTYVFARIESEEEEEE